MKLTPKQRREINKQLKELNWKFNDFKSDPIRYYNMSQFQGMSHDEIKRWFEERIWDLERKKL